jgi:hypothetical protein
MKGTIFDFLKLAAGKPDLAKGLVELAAKHDFEFADEVSDEDLENVTGGATLQAQQAGATGNEGPSIDPMALVQSVIRQSYLENLADLRQQADQVRSFNEQKEG